MTNSQPLERMKTSLLHSRAVLFAGLVLLIVADLPAAAQDLYDPLEHSGWFVRVDAAARFNLKANIKAFPVQRGTGIYDNGSVLPDVGGTASGTTWNWSYQSAGQVAYDLNNQPESIVFRRLEDVPTIGSRDVDLTSPVLEGEVVGGFRYDFDIGRRKAGVAFELGYGYFSSSDSMNFQSAGIATRTLFPHRLRGVVPPLPPYAGTFRGPGPLLDLYPDPALSSTNRFATTTVFKGSLDIDFHNFRMGPSFNIDLTSRLNAQFGIGYDSLYASATLNYRESSAYIPNAKSVNLRGSDWRSGLYTEILLNWQLTRNVQVFLGGDFQYNEDLVFSNSRHQVTLQLGSTYAAKAGVSYSF